MHHRHWAARFWIIVFVFTGVAHAAEQEILRNGLEVIYAPMRDAPVVHIRMVYHVGSRDESPDRHGFAHLFEHMMFRGSAHVGTDEHVRLIRAAGGVYNGETSHDATSYFETLPRNQLALGLYLEADRMASFHVTDETFRIERNVVLEELSRRELNPESASIEDLLSEVFKVGPYHWSPDGDPADVRAAKVAELQRFFDTYYLPNNATMVIAGDFEIPEARQLVRRYFEWIPKGEDIARRNAAEPPQTASRRVEIGRPVPNRLFLVGCRVPPAGSDEDAAIVALQQAIGGRVLRYLELDTRPLCSSTFTRYVQLKDDGCLCFGGMLLADTDLAEVERIVNVRLRLLREEGIVLNEMDFNGLTDELCSNLQYRRMTADGQGADLAWGQVICGDPEQATHRIERLRQLTAPKLREVAEKYLQPEKLTYLIVNPKLVRPVTVAANPNDRKPDEVPANSTRRIEFPADYPATAPFAVEIVANPFKRITELRVHGCRVLLVPEFKPDALELRILLPRGWHDDPAGKEGMAALATTVMIATAQRQNRELTVGMPLHAPFPFGVPRGAESTQIVVTAPMGDAEHLMRELNYSLRQQLETGVFDGFLIGLKRRTLTEERANDDLLNVVADKDLRMVIFDGSPLGREPTAASLRAISPADLEACRRRMFDLSRATIIIGGKMTPERATNLIERMLDGWPTEPADWASASAGVPARAARTRPRIILVDAPASPQSLIRIGSAAFGWADERKPASELGEWILSQRIWRHVRDEKGYAYVVSAGFEQFRGGGMFVLRTETSVDSTAATVSTLLTDVTQMSAEPVTPQELAESKTAYAGSTVSSLQMPQQQALWRAEALLRDEPATLPERIGGVQAVRVEQIQQLFKQYAGPGQLTVVIVAPAAELRQPLSQLGDVEVRAMPSYRPGASTRPVYEEIPLGL